MSIMDKIAASKAAYIVNNPEKREPSIVALGDKAYERLVARVGKEQGDQWHPSTITVSGRILGLHVMHDPSLTDEEIEVRK